MKKQKGFAFIELLLVLLVLAIVALIGVYAWRHHQEHVVSRNVSTTKRVPYTHPGVWVAYTSTHSSLHFTYPSDWRLIHNAVPNNGPTLEDVSLDGPNNFVVTFILAKRDVNPAAQCVLAYYGPTVALNSTYSIASTLSSSNKSQINSIALVRTDSVGSEGGSGCAPDISGNPIGSDLSFTLEGWYEETASGYAVIPKAASSYFALPEVETAKTIFKSVTL